VILDHVKVHGIYDLPHMIAPIRKIVVAVTWKQIMAFEHDV
jgi:hypothetical protein